MADLIHVLHPDRILLLCLLTLSVLINIADGAAGGPAHCVWYGQCGRDAVFGRPSNCAYNGTAIALTDREAISRLGRVCPQLAKDNNVHTCCDKFQLRTFEEQMSFIEMTFGKCPSCYRNYKEIFCRLTCAPNQSTFMAVSQTEPYMDKKLRVKAVDYALHPDFAEGMYSSCAGVKLRTSGNPAIEAVCGRPATECNVTTLLEYVGREGSTRINFHVTRTPYKWLTPVNDVIVPCNKAVSNESQACFCEDCRRPKCRRIVPKDNVTVILPYLEIRITPKNTSWYRHPNRAPLTGSTRYGPVFRKDFLHKVLELQDTVMGLKTFDSAMNTSLKTWDVCFKPREMEGNYNCSVTSILQYFQNNATRLDAVATDQYGFLTYADYIDHYEYCIRNPAAEKDETGLQLPCLSLYGEEVTATSILRGFTGNDYGNATGLLLRLSFQPDQGYHDHLVLWKTAFEKYMLHLNHPNMTVSYIFRHIDVYKPYRFNHGSNIQSSLKVLVLIMVVYFQAATASW